MLLLLLFMFIISFFVTAISIPLIIRYCREKKIGGNDVHKKGKPFVPGLGGVGILLGIIFSLSFAFIIFSSPDLSILFDSFYSKRLADFLLFSIFIVLLTGLIGLVDDFFSIPHRLKLVLPLLIAIPIIILKSSWMHVISIPLFGELHLPPLFYLYLLVPIGVMAVTNVANTFAGYNGLEAGLAAIISFFFIIIGLNLNHPAILLLSVPLLAASLAFLIYNWYPARIFIDDVGTLVIGAIYSEIVIIGGIEVIGFILLSLYIADFLFFKVPNNLPSKNWWGTYRNGRLYHHGKSVHLGQFVLSRFNGLKEYELVMLFLSIQIILGLIAILVSLL
ncbi:MAG: hypothetical protein NZ903_00955 [Candidatus Micrarchaeota archaeon]|nr:hypothetical protein [Candidatus Micrarchaeota archaeon]